MGESGRLVRLCYTPGSPGWRPQGLMNYKTGMCLSPVSLQLPMPTITIDCFRLLFRDESILFLTSWFSLASAMDLSFLFLSQLMAGIAIENARLDTD
jgi:hypothetical protein